jgi:pyruvate/2-oxoglutarate/acetoin dehydrogenase E1 component
LEAVKDPNPVLFIEHRWLYETTSEMMSTEMTPIFENPDMTIIGIGHTVIEVRKAILALPDIKINLVELQKIKPIGKYEVRGHNFLVVDDAWDTGSIANQIALSFYHMGAEWVGTVTCEDYPSASSPYLTENYYPSAQEIVNMICGRLGIEEPTIALRSHPDVPDARFRGPF